MKIALLIEKFSARGGAERMVGYLTRGLAGRGHEVHGFASEFDDGPVVRHPIPRGSHTAYARACGQAVEEGRFDVVHSFTRTLRHDILRLGGGVHAEYLRRMARARSVIGQMWSMINPKEHAILRLEREGLQSAQIIQAVSERVKGEVLDHYPVDPRKIVVMHNGVDLARFNPSLRQGRAAVLSELGLLPETFLLLFVGSGARRKGLATALAVLERLPSSNLHLVVVGDARTRAKDPRVHLLGMRADIERLYGAADALVLPTLYDPFPNVCLEALACGVPVIVTRVAGVSEIITDGADSFVVEDPGDPGEIAQRVERLMRGHERELIVKRARALAERFPIEKYIDDTIALYARLAR